MPAFLKDIAPFYGTGEKNEQGQDLEHFLEEYNPNRYPNPSVTADIIVIQYEKGMTSIETGLKLLMIKRRNHPSIGYWALPGGFVELHENIDTAAKRELMEETGLKDVAMEQLYCYGEVSRDPRTRIITVSYLALIEQQLKVTAGDDAADAVWFDITFQKVDGQTVDEARAYQKYNILLENTEKNIKLSALVEYSENITGILKDPKYKIIHADQIAFDHPVFIVQALLYFKSLIL